MFHEGPSSKVKIAEDTCINFQLEVIDSRGPTRIIHVKADQNALVETLEGLVRNQHKKEGNLAFDVNCIKSIDKDGPRFLFPSVSFMCNSVKNGSTLQATRVYHELEEASNGLKSDADSAYMSGEEEEDKKASAPTLEIKQELARDEPGINSGEYNKCSDYYNPGEYYDTYDSTDDYYY